MSTYDLIDVRIGSEIIQARPVEWSKVPIDVLDQDSQPMATSYVTTCPHCSQLIKFAPSDITVINGVNNIKCTTCTVKNVASDADIQNQQDRLELFVDPIKAGLIATDNFIIDAN